MSQQLYWWGWIGFTGINPDGSQYNVEDIRNALQSVTGQLPGIQCNKDQSGNRQLYQVYVCVATDGQTVIQCPIFPSNECKGSVEFPVYQPNSAASSDANPFRSDL
jgi:ribonuclease T2